MIAVQPLIQFLTSLTFNKINLIATVVLTVKAKVASQLGMLVPLATK